MSLSDLIFGKNPAKKAQPYLEKIGPMAEQRYNPYIERGNRAYESLEPLYQRFANNPAEYLNELQQSYKPSTGYAFKEKKALDAARNAAAAGGYSGTPYHQTQAAELAANIGGEDMQQWLQNVLGIQAGGIGGQQGLANQGYESNNALTDILGNTLNQQAGLAFQGQAQRNKNRSDLYNTAGQAAGAYFGAGGQLPNLSALFGGQQQAQQPQGPMGYGSFDARRYSSPGSSVVNSFSYGSPDRFASSFNRNLW
jgi:hypothetical protein